MTRTMMTGIVLVLALALGASASAQPAAGAAQQRPAQAAGGPAFVDANGDGICDNFAAGGRFGQGMRGGFGRGMRGGMGLAFGPAGLSLIDIVARATGQDRTAVLQALQGGRTLAQVGEASGKSVRDLADAVLAERQAAVSQAVAAGRLTAQQADQMTAWMRTRVELSLAGTWQPRGRGFWPPGRFSQPAVPAPQQVK